MNMLLNEVETKNELNVDLRPEIVAIRELQEAELLAVGGGSGDVVLG